MSERNIVEKLFESRRIAEAEFTQNGNVYKAAFGRYTMNDKSITADAYHKAREDSLKGQRISDYKKLEDDDLVILANKGDKKATESLITRYKSLAYYLGKNLYLPGGDKDDLAQEALLGLYSAMKDYKPGSNKDFKQFAILAMKRNMQDAIRSANAQKNQFINKADDIETAYDKPSNRQNPERIFNDKEDMNRLKDYMKKNLTSHENDVLKYYLQGYKYNEIADKLGRSRKSVDNAMNNVRSKLRKYQELYKESKIVGKLLESIETRNIESMRESYMYLYK